MTLTMEVSIIVAYSKKNRGIGFQNGLPWKLPGDMKYFKNKTKNENENGNVFREGIFTKIFFTQSIFSPRKHLHQKYFPHIPQISISQKNISHIKYSSTTKYKNIIFSYFLIECAVKIAVFVLLCE